MEEAIVDVTPDLNLPPYERPVQSGDQENMLTDNQDQTQLLASDQKGLEASSQCSERRATLVESLRLSVAAGTYHIDSAELALCILHNSTHFLETR
jgi:anti-sigma28 factor (negative regulator of flagellin synthesis)